MTIEETQRLEALEKTVISFEKSLVVMIDTDLMMSKILVAMAKSIFSLRDDQIERLRARASSDTIPDGPEKQKILSLIASKLEQPKDQADAELEMFAEKLKKISAEMRVRIEETQKLFGPVQPPPAPA